MKASALRELTEEELQQKERDAQKELFALRLQQATAQIEKPSRLRELRREVARIRTLLAERRRT
jgi:large subunit ribosomal protein L29